MACEWKRKGEEIENFQKYATEVAKQSQDIFREEVAPGDITRRGASRLDGGVCIFVTDKAHMLTRRKSRTMLVIESTHLAVLISMLFLWPHAVVLDVLSCLATTIGCLSTGTEMSGARMCIIHHVSSNLHEQMRASLKLDSSVYTSYSSIRRIRKSNR